MLLLTLSSSSGGKGPNAGNAVVLDRGEAELDLRLSLERLTVKCEQGLLFGVTSEAGLQWIGARPFFWVRTPTGHAHGFLTLKDGQWYSEI